MNTRPLHAYAIGSLVRIPNAGLDNTLYRVGPTYGGRTTLRDPGTAFSVLTMDSATLAEDCEPEPAKAEDREPEPAKAANELLPTSDADALAAHGERLEVGVTLGGDSYVARRCGGRDYLIAEGYAIPVGDLPPAVVTDALDEAAARLATPKAATATTPGARNRAVYAAAREWIADALAFDEGSMTTSAELLGSRGVPWDPVAVMTAIPGGPVHAATLARAMLAAGHLRMSDPVWDSMRAAHTAGMRRREWAERPGVYLAGPIRSDLAGAVARFRAAWDAVYAAGYRPVLPADMDTGTGYTSARVKAPSGLTDPRAVGNALIADFELILDCVGVYLLPGWEASTGCRVERAFIAATTKIPCRESLDDLRLAIPLPRREVRISDPTGTGIHMPDSE